MHNSNNNVDNRILDLFNNGLNLNLSLSTKNILFENLNKYNDNFKESKKKDPQKTFCYYNLALVDNIIKNMHEKWSYID
jgi:hypothetical protein